MKILYVHGFGSKFDPSNEKVVALSQLGEVIGVDVDYTSGYGAARLTVVEAAADAEVDLIVGTSLGGYMAAQVGSAYGVPFVAINPAIAPAETMLKYVGSGVDFAGRTYTLTEEVADSYPDIVTHGAGLVLLDEDDEVLPSKITRAFLGAAFRVVMFPGGNHRFAHIAESLPLIESHYNTAGVVYN
jgi:uncharacterized protein